jgi:hypothetical protein
MRAARISRSAAVPSCGVFSMVEQQEDASALLSWKCVATFDQSPNDPENVFGSMFGHFSRDFHVIAT